MAFHTARVDDVVVNLGEGAPALWEKPAPPAAACAARCDCLFQTWRGDDEGVDSGGDAHADARMRPWRSSVSTTEVSV